jgi:hypothetical protein
MNLNPIDHLLLPQILGTMPDRVVPSGVVRVFDREGPIEIDAPGEQPRGLGGEMRAVGVLQSL